MKTTHNKQNIYFVYGDAIAGSIDRLFHMPDNSTIVVPHVCNNVNAFGAGFAGAIANEFPIVKENFHLLGKANAKLGKVQYITAVENKQKNKLIIANMIAQNGLISSENKRPLNYAALVYCLRDISLFCTNILHNNDDSSVEIHAPKFGCGLAGGNWNFINDIISDTIHNIPVYIYNHRRTIKK